MPVKNVPAGKSMIARDTRAKKTEVLKRNDNKASRRRFFQKIENIEININMANIKHSGKLHANSKNYFQKNVVRGLPVFNDPVPACMISKANSTRPI